MDCRTLSKDPGAFENGLAEIKNALVKRIFIFIWAQYTRVYKCLHRKTYQGLSSTSCWAVPRKLSVRGHLSIRTIFLFCCGKLISKVCQSVLDTSCIKGMHTDWSQQIPLLLQTYKSKLNFMPKKTKLGDWSFFTNNDSFNRNIVKFMTISYVRGRITPLT